MSFARQPLVEAALELAWSHWGALGVRGVPRPPMSAVDPEALLYLTACLVEHDPRLRDEVGDWWNKYKRHLSRPRMNALAKRFGPTASSKLKELEASFARTIAPAGKSRLDHLHTPARSLLRLRCAVGATARAEILLEFLTGSHGEVGLAARALSEVGYSKRNIASVLEDLRLAGMLTATRDGNRILFRLADPEGLEHVLRPLPSIPGRWHVRLPVVAAFVELADRVRDRDVVVQGIEARKTFETLLPRIVAAGAPSSGPKAIAETYWAELQRWLVDAIIVERADAVDRLPGMLAGVWVGPNQAPTRPLRYASGVLPRSTTNADAAVKFVGLDLVQVPTVEPVDDWVWAVLSTAATTTYAHTIGLDNREEGWRFVTWDLGGERAYRVDYADPIPHAQLARAYGNTAAARARADYPAVQLQFTRLDGAVPR